MDFETKGKTVVITGGAGGLGSVMASGFLDDGATVVLVDVDEDKLQEFEEANRDANGRLHTKICDVTDAAQVQSTWDEIERSVGMPDVLVNSIHRTELFPPHEIPLETWNEMIRVNVSGFHIPIQATGSRWIAQGRPGVIIILSSISGRRAQGRGSYAYSIAKGALTQMTRELAVEWAKYGIRVNALEPSQIATDAYLERALEPVVIAAKERIMGGIPMGRLGKPEDIVGPALFLASGASAFVTGVTLPVDGGNLAMNAGGSHS